MFTTCSPLGERRVHPQEAKKSSSAKSSAQQNWCSYCSLHFHLSISIMESCLACRVLWLKLLVLVADRVASPWHVVPGSSTAMPADRTENGDAESAAQVSWTLRIFMILPFLCFVLFCFVVSSFWCICCILFSYCFVVFECFGHLVISILVRSNEGSCTFFLPSRAVQGSRASVCLRLWHVCCDLGRIS